MNMLWVLARRRAAKDRVKHVRRSPRPHRVAPLNTAGGCSLFGGLDEEQWAAFMGALEAGLAQALKEGRWKQAAAHGKAGNFGASCPRF